MKDSYTKRVALLIEKVEEAMRLEEIIPSKDKQEFAFGITKYPLASYYCQNKELIVVVYENIDPDSEVEFTVSVFDGSLLNEMKANAGEEDDVLYYLDESNLILYVNQYLDKARNVEELRNLLVQSRNLIKYLKKKGL